MRGRVLIVAGSDSGGGAGIQADIKTVTALGGFAATAITALTAQNTEGVFGVMAVEPGFVQRQMRVVLDDIGADCIKTGMLHTAAVIDAVCDVLDEAAAAIPVVVDPVMVAKGGAALLDPAAVEVLIARLLPRSAVITPNLPEAEALTGLAIADKAAMAAAAERLCAMGAPAVLLKGGHLPGDTVSDFLLWRGGARWFEARRTVSRHTHGTGCTLASALATGIAQGLPLDEAVGRAIGYVQEAIRRAPGYGRGSGPIDHGHTMREGDG